MLAAAAEICALCSCALFAWGDVNFVFIRDHVDAGAIQSFPLAAACISRCVKLRSVILDGENSVWFRSITVV